jgi:hypothetical protein
MTTENKKAAAVPTGCRIRWRLGWHRGEIRFSPVALRHRLSTALLWAACLLSFEREHAL